MRPISWLHISDIHLRPLDAWPQKVVMEAMCEDINRHFARAPADFILVSGDLAFTGRTEDYALVETFLDKVRAAAGVPRERIFCIPGNHDVRYPQLIRKALGYATIDGRIREAGRMNPSRKNATEPLWQTRRRYVWPAYSLIAAGILIMALNRAQSGWSLVGALVFGLAAFDLSISARIYGTQQRTLEAVIVWFGVGVVAFGACFSLFAWPT